MDTLLWDITVLRQHSAKLAVTFVLTAWICISLNDVVMKLLSTSYALHQLVFIRSIGGLLLTLLIIHFGGSWGLLKIDNKLLYVFLRAVLGQSHGGCMKKKCTTFL